MSKFAVGDNVFVPASALGSANEATYALVKRRVQATRDRSVTVDDLAGNPVDVGTARVHDERLGFLVLKVGDLATEELLLDPLAKSVLQFLRLLLPDDHVRALSVRTLVELNAFWTANHAGFSHVVLIGHGSSGQLGFVDEGSVEGEDLVRRLASPVGIRQKVFLSLACSSGRKAFAKAFSEAGVCSHLVAPFGALHGAAASHFAQTFFVSLLLQGMKPARAFGAAAASVKGETHFRLWQSGKIKAGKK